MGGFAKIGALLGAPFHSLLDLVKVSSRPQLALSEEVKAILSLNEFIPPLEPRSANTNFSYSRYYAQLTGQPFNVVADATYDLPCPADVAWLVHRASFGHYRPAAGTGTGGARISLVSGGVEAIQASDIGIAGVQGQISVENLWVPPGVTLRFFFDYTGPGGGGDTQALMIGATIYAYPAGWAGRS